MVQFGKKKPYTEYLYSKPSLVILACAVLFLSIAVFERFSIEREMYARRVAAENEQQQLILRKEQLSEKVEYLEGERGIEEEIRKHFDVAREGEQVVILTGSDQKNVVVQEEIEPPAPWYVFWR